MATLAHARGVSTSATAAMTKMRFPMPKRITAPPKAGSSAAAPRPLDTPAPAPSLAPLQAISPGDVSTQRGLRLRGMRLTGDPGSPTWSAPFYIPEHLQAGVPRALLSDPWPAVDERAHKAGHARLLLEHLRKAAPERFTAQQVCGREGGLGERLWLLF